MKRMNDMDFRHAEGFVDSRINLQDQFTVGTYNLLSLRAASVLKTAHEQSIFWLTSLLDFLRT